MAVSTKETKDPFIEKIYNESMKDLRDFFTIDWYKNMPEIVTLPDRKSIDSLFGKKTEDWLVAWADRNKVFILDRENYEKESNHKYSDEEYSALLKHELAHLFIGIPKGKGYCPKWFEEGICIYISGQLEMKKPVKKLECFLDYYDEGGEGVYKESGFAIEVLMKKFGKGKFLKLLADTREIRNRKEFDERFEKVYGMKAEYESFK